MNSPVPSYPCPACRATANLATGCPNCGRAPDPVAAEVVRLNSEIAVLTRQVEQARQTYLSLGTRLQASRQRRDELAAQVRRTVSPAAVAPVAQQPVAPAVQQPVAPVAQQPVVPAPRQPAAPVPTAAGVPAAIRPEASTRTVQNLLFTLGGLLLCTAAIVFTAVAWRTVGLVGRSVILAGLTGLALAIPPLARWRALVATAETFAVVGLLLVVLDGYAAWAVNLFGVATWPGPRYAALVATVTALVAAGYGRLTRLAAPWFAMLPLTQAVPPLLAADAELNSAGWSASFTVLALLDLAVVWRLGTPVSGDTLRWAGRLSAWIAAGGALAASGVTGLIALLLGTPHPALAGVPLLGTAILLVLASLIAGLGAFQVAAIAGTTLLAGVALLRPVAELPENRLLVTAALVILGTSLAAAATGHLLPVRLRPGPRTGALVLTGVLAVPVSVLVITVVLVSVTGQPVRAIGLLDLDGPVDWQLPMAVLLITAALSALLPRGMRPGTAVVGATGAMLAAPGALTLAAVPEPIATADWTVPVLNLMLAVPLLLTAVRTPGGGTAGPVGTPGGTDAGTAEPPGPPGRSAAPGYRPSALLQALCGASLAGHALLVTIGRPAAGTLVLVVILLTGLAMAAAVDPQAAAHRRLLGHGGLVAGLLAAPMTADAALAAFGASEPWQARGALLVTGLLVPVLAGVRRRRPDRLAPAGLALAVATVLTGIGGGLVGEPPALYAAVAALLVAAGLVITAGSRALWVAGLLLLIRAGVVVLWALIGVFSGLAGWLTAIWSGVPAGVGLMPDDWRPQLPVGLALAILAGTAALAAWRVTRNRTVAVGTGSALAALALPVLLAALGARWPVVPVVAFLSGLAGLLAAALSRRTVRLVPVTVPLGALLSGAGLAGLLPTRTSTLIGLGALVASAVTVGVAGRWPAARLVGWPVAVGAGGTLAVVATLAAAAPLRVAAFAVLAVATLTLATSTALMTRRPTEAAALEAFAHASAVVAALLPGTRLRYVAIVCTLWGVVIGVRALWPGESARRRLLLGLAAGGCELLAFWLLLGAEQVALLEAYTLPAALLALPAGWLVLRRRPELSSWVAYGPGLGAVLLPSLAAVLLDADPPLRRLLLGGGALLVVLLGARWRRQAPVVLGGAVLALVALHELVIGWDRVPRWLFLAAGGFILIGLAVTYERQRRELARLRAAVRRMR